MKNLLIIHRNIHFIHSIHWIPENFSFFEVKNVIRNKMNLNLTDEQIHKFIEFNELVLKSDYEDLDFFHDYESIVIESVEIPNK